MFAALGLLGPIFSAIGGIAKGFFEHKMAKVEAGRQVELAQIESQTKAQSSWQNGWVTILFTLPFGLAIFGIYMPLVRLFDIMENAPTWYQTVVLLIVSGSFGLNLHGQYKADKLQREIVWDRHKANGGGNDVTAYGSGRGSELQKATPPVEEDPRAAYLKELENRGG